MWSTGMLPASITPIDFACLLIIFIAIISLAVPLVSYVNIIFGSKVKSKDYSNGKRNPTKPRSTTANYPSVPSTLPSAAPELSVIHLPYPTPVNKSSEEEVNSTKNDDESVPAELVAIRGNKEETKSQNPPRRSILVSYNSYRHKLIEETLQKQYGGGYAPGNVILNLIQLNTADSAANGILGDKYDGISFFDDIKLQSALCDTEISAAGRKEMEFPDPLDHFIPRNMKKVSMTEMQTETANPSEVSVVIESSISPSTRPNTPTSCQRIIPKRSCEVNYMLNKKSPFPTPVQSQAPLNTPRKSDLVVNGRTTEVVNLLQNVRARDKPVLTEQLYRRNDTRPDVVSKTHVEAEEYLNRIVKNRRFEIPAKEIRDQEPRIRSSLKKTRQYRSRGGKYFSDDEKVSNDKTEDFEKAKKAPRDEIRQLSTSKPTIWNNRFEDLSKNK